jgi:hypothetical protein
LGDEMTGQKRYTRLENVKGACDGCGLWSMLKAAVFSQPYQKGLEGEGRLRLLQPVLGPFGRRLTEVGYIPQFDKLGVNRNERRK